MNRIDEKVLLIGGGGGVYRVARSLKHSRPNLTTIQTMFDHGGHSGKLRDERGALPHGDIRQAILALSDDDIEPALRILLSYRFSKQNGSSVDDVSIGNLMLTALTESYGDPITAIKAMCRIFRVKGKVLPVSLDHADLCAELSDGTKIKGEGNIDTRSHNDDRTIVSVSLEPSANIYEEAYDAIVSADKIIFCPGDLFTSLIPNSLTNGFKEAIANTKAQLIYTVNIMTKKAETPGFTASQFTKILLHHIGRDKFDFVICNSTPIEEDIRMRYAEEKAEPVKVDDELSNYVRKIILEDLAVQSGGIIRHNQKLTPIICSL
jgi:uncharacterized cofD-like protein